MCRDVKIKFHKRKEEVKNFFKKGEKVDNRTETITMLFVYKLVKGETDSREKVNRELENSRERLRKNSKCST